MKRVLRTAMMALLVMVMCIGTLVPAAQAASSSFAVDIPINITVTGSEPVEGAYAKFTVIPLTEGAPMPHVYDGETLTWFVPVDSTGKTTYFLSMEFPEIGVYRYTIQMTGGTYYHADEDATLYNIEVYNLSDGYDDTVEIWTGDNRTKCDSLDYQIPLNDIKVAKKWVDQNSSRPTSVSVDLYSGNDVAVLNVMNFQTGKTSVFEFSSIVLNSKNNWQSSWTGLDGRTTYTVKETKVPAGYTASYKFDKETNIWTITNTGSLLQTGQLNWPIPVLCVSGFLMVAFGLMLMIRKKEEKDV